MPSKIKSKISKLPKKPGVYVMKDRRKRVIYIGKARNLKQRVSHYYQESGNIEPKTSSLIKQVKDIDYLATDSEIDAMLLEAKLIRDIKPKYNVQLKDDKTFPLLAVTLPNTSVSCFGGTRDDFPRVFITRERGKKNITYFGPFTNAGDLRSALKLLQRIFKFRTCLRAINTKQISKPCLLYHIKECVAPCLGKITKEEYAEIIHLLVKFLNGNKDLVITELTQRMNKVSQKQDFERAALYRDQINALKGITCDARMGQFYEGALASITPSERIKDLQILFGLENPPRKIEGIDISDLRGNEAVGALVTFIDGEPFKNGYRRYKIRTVTEGEPDDYERMREVVQRRIKDKENPLPDILLLDGGRGHLMVIEQVFAREKVTPPIIAALSKSGGDHLVTNLQVQIPKFKLIMKHSAGFTLLQYIRDEAHRFAQKYHHILRKKLFQEDKFPDPAVGGGIK